MKLVFLGTPQVAVPALATLLSAGHDVGLVITQPDRPTKRSRRPVAPPVKRFAEERGIEVRQPRRVRNPAFREALAATQAELLVVVAYGRILPAAVLDQTRHGAINLHFSLLPAYRGAAPVQWALVRGESVTGVTTMRINERMDEGDLLLQSEVAIEKQEHAPALADRLARVGAALLEKTLAGLPRGEPAPRPQNHDLATYAPLLTRAHGAVDPVLEAREIAARVRGFDPWPGVWLQCRGNGLRIVEALAIEGPAVDEVAGTLVESTPDGPVMACGQGSRLLLSRVQLAGGRPIGGRDALNGRHLRVGERLEQAPERR